MTDIKSRVQEAKIYAVLFREDVTDRLMLMTFLAYSLDDVYEAMRSQMPPREQWLPFMWHAVPIKDLIKDSMKTVEVQKIPTPAEMKNALMKKIIETRDGKLLEDNKPMFSTEEYAYISGKIIDLSSSNPKDNGETKQSKRPDRK